MAGTSPPYGEHMSMNAVLRSFSIQTPNVYKTAECDGGSRRRLQENQHTTKSYRGNKNEAFEELPIAQSFVLENVKRKSFSFAIRHEGPGSQWRAMPNIKHLQKNIKNKTAAGAFECGSPDDT